LRPPITSRYTPSRHEHRESSFSTGEPNRTSVGFTSVKVYTCSATSLWSWLQWAEMDRGRWGFKAGHVASLAGLSWQMISEFGNRLTVPRWCWSHVLVAACTTGVRRLRKVLGRRSRGFSQLQTYCTLPITEASVPRTSGSGGAANHNVYFYLPALPDPAERFFGPTAPAQCAFSTHSGQLGRNYLSICPATWVPVNAAEQSRQVLTRSSLSRRWGMLSFDGAGLTPSPSMAKPSYTSDCMHSS
jgi:hypothetical protein